MPKTAGIPKSLLADINKLKTRLTSLEKANSSLLKEFKNTIKEHATMIKKQEQTIASLGKRSAKREKRKPSAYNLFLKDKMSQGMSMVEAVKSWKEKEGGMSTSSSMRQSSTSPEWQQQTQQY
jgi:hypothetical protein